MLALHANRTVSIDRLAEGLWGEEPPSSAPKMVQLYVSQLRRVLQGEGAAIITHGRGYELCLTDDDVDAARFERLVNEGRPREALALWRGEALADVADQPFADAEIRRLEELRLRAHELAVDADLASGRHKEVIGELEALVAKYPLSERLHGKRMLALYRAERQAEALDAYRQARAALVDEIGVEPGPELRRLQDAILAQDPALDLPAVEPSARPPPAPSRPSGHRRGRAFLVAAALVAAASLILFGITRLTVPDRLPRIDENSVGVIDPDDGRITAQYPVGRNPGAVVAGGGSVWVANTLDGTVSRIDRDPDRVVTIPVGGTPAGLAFGAGSLWVADGDARTVAQLEPGANKVVQRIAVGNAPLGIAAGYGALWVASGVDGSVRRIDLSGDATSRSIPVGSNPTAIAAGAGAIWVASEEAGTVSRIEPRSGAVVRAIHVGNGPSAVAVGEGAVWAVNRQDGTVSRIDPATNAVSWTVGLGGEPLAVAAGDGAVWVAGGAAGTVTSVDPDAPGVLQRVEAGASPAGVAVADREVWATAAAPPAAHHGGTLRVRYTSIPPNALPIDWLDPAGYNWPTAQLTSLAYDGLVAYRRVGGAAGGTLVGALATSAPQPSPDGRSYVFTVRPGLRYSDGTPVQAGDFRASMERFLQVTRDTFPPFYAGIVGAEQCMAQPARCDLSAGIETDQRARTITVHLTRPDAEFLHKLTSPFAYVVPADTPLRRTGDHPPPGTGPYRSPPGKSTGAVTWSAIRTSARRRRRAALPASPTASRWGSAARRRSRTRWRTCGAGMPTSRCSSSRSRAATRPSVSQRSQRGRRGSFTAALLRPPSTCS
jgi:YVTN family beta-propeller protein